MLPKHQFFNKVEKNDSITENASKQKWFNIIIDNNGKVESCGLWARDVNEAELKAFSKWYYKLIVEIKES